MEENPLIETPPPQSSADVNQMIGELQQMPLPKELADRIQIAKLESDLAVTRVQMAQLNIDKLFFECCARMNLNPDQYILKQGDGGFFFVKK